LQSEITGRIAFALNLEMVDAEAARPIGNPEASDYIFRGREALSGRSPSRENYDAAIGLYERALALDPQSTAAKTYLAGALINHVFSFPTASAPADLARAGRPIDEALAAGTRIPWAHYVKGSVLRAQGQWAAAIPEFETALALNRNMTGPLQGLGWCKLFTGSLDEVIPLAEKGIRIGPRDSRIGFRYFQIGEVHELQGRPDAAIGWLEKTRAAIPALAGPLLHLASIHALAGDARRAAAELAAARDLNPHLYPSIARLKASQPWGVPKVQAMFEATYFTGLRKAGMPEE
jgi:adenylate cyclase